MTRRNLLGDEWEGGRDRPGWQWRYANVGSPKIGASLYELAPGQATFPTIGTSSRRSG